MNREIKFRVWEKVQKVMLLDGFALSPKGDVSFYWNEKPIHSANAILMQFTGLKDKTRNQKFPQGVDIYEGDIFEWADLVGVVEFKDGCFVFQCKSMGMTMRDHEASEYKVVGNIYETPDPVTK